MKCSVPSGKYARSTSGRLTNQRRMSRFASSMKKVPIRLPTPREPLWSMNQTRSS